MKNKNQQPLISLVMVIRNEELTLERCLKSAYRFVDEIIIIHDGKCLDESKKIAKKYNAIFKEVPRKYEAEFHRITSYKLAKNNWILQLDADEFIDKKFWKETQSLMENSDIILINWEIYHNKKSFLNYMDKTILFKKSKISFISCPHENQNPIDNQVIIHKANSILYHRPKVDYLGNTKNYIKKANSWVPVHAKALKNWKSLKRYNCKAVNEKRITPNFLISKNFLTIPFIIIPFIIVSCWKQFFKTKNSLFLFIFPFNLTLYYWILFVEIIKNFFYSYDKH